MGMRYEMSIKCQTSTEEFSTLAESCHYGEIIKCTFRDILFVELDVRIFNDVN